MNKTVLFLCSANMYRSRLAEILFNYYAPHAQCEWRAISRAIGNPDGLSGMSGFTRAYLEERGLPELAESPRDPLPVSTQEFENCGLIVGLCRAEHESLVNNKFIGLAKARVASGSLRFWNVYDARVRLPGLLRWIAKLGGHPVQQEASGTEHIDFAVRALIGELAQR